MSDTTSEISVPQAVTIILEISNVPKSPTKEQVDEIIKRTSETLLTTLAPDRLVTEGVVDWVLSKLKIKLVVHNQTSVDGEISN